MDWTLFWWLFGIIAAYSIGRAVGKDIGRSERGPAVPPLRFSLLVNGDHLGGFGFDLVPESQLSKFDPPNTEENTP